MKEELDALFELLTEEQKVFIVTFIKHFFKISL